ncbi:MAG: hypothetical protein MJ241_03815 [Bacilli bacterium]|nr:hypothetical protein [Bacilli bacterium]
MKNKFLLLVLDLTIILSACGNNVSAIKSSISNLSSLENTESIIDSSVLPSHDSEESVEVSSSDYEPILSSQENIESISETSASVAEKNKILKEYFNIYIELGGILEYEDWLSTILTEDEQEYEIMSVEQKSEWLYLIFFSNGSTKEINIYNFNDPLFYGVDQSKTFNVENEENGTIIIKYENQDIAFENRRTNDSFGRTEYSRTIKTFKNGKTVSIENYKFDDRLKVYVGYDKTEYKYERKDLERLFESVYYLFDNTSKSFVPSYKIVNLYEKKSDLISYSLEYTYDEGRFILFRKNTYLNGEISGSFDYLNVSPSQETYETHTYSYNENGQISELIKYRINNSTNAMTPYEKTSFLYDTYGNEVENAIFVYKNGAYIPSKKTSRSFDAQGNKLTEKCYTSGVVDGATVFVGTVWNQYAFDSEGRLTETNSFSWDKEQKEWIMVVNTSTVYENTISGFRTTFIHNDLRNGYTSKEITDVDHNGNNLSIKYCRFDQESGTWNIRFEKTWQYDMNGNNTEYLYAETHNGEITNILEKLTCEYNNAGQCTKEDYYNNIIDPGELGNKPIGTITQNEYDENGKISRITVDRYREDPEVLKKVSIYCYDYFESGEKERETYFIYDESSEVCVGKDISYFDKSGNCVKFETYSHILSSDEYKLIDTRENTYIDGVLRAVTYESFLFQQSSYKIYDEKGRLIQRLYNSFLMEEYKYDQNGNVLFEEKWAEYGSVDGAPLENTKVERLYSDDGNIILETFYRFDARSNIWSSYTKTYNYQDGLLTEVVISRTQYGEWVEKKN